MMRILGTPGSIRRLATLGGASLVVLASLGYGGYLWHQSLTQISTDDAYVAGHIAPVSARVAGPVIEVLVTDNQQVKRGDLLVRLDPRDYETALAQAKAAVEIARGEFQNAALTVPLTAASTSTVTQQTIAALAGARYGVEMATHDLEERRSELRAKESVVAGADAGVRVAEADLERTRQDRDRLVALFKAQLVARQDLDHAESAVKSAQATLDAAQHKLAEARGEAQRAKAAVQTQEAAVEQATRRVDEARATTANAEAQHQQVGIKEAQVEAARGRLAQALANVRQAELSLEYTRIHAPVDGRVTKKNVEVGQVVPPGQPLLALVDTHDVWVIANYKETQLAPVRPGQPATITVDTYPGAVIRARVDSIQAGSGTVFSLLPPENASGNFVKVVQRLPVKLVIDRADASRYPLFPGMSVVPSIDARGGRLGSP
jgi:membrane fusion protein (multidrug efflux system)